MLGLGVTTGTYYGDGYVSAGSSSSRASYNKTVTSSKLNQLSRNAAANYSLQMETIQNYLEDGKVEKALELYEELFSDIKSTSTMGDITLNDSQIATIASNAYAGNTGSSIVESVKENTCGSFWTGFKQSIPIVGLFCNGTSEAEAMAQLTGTEVSAKDKALEFLGMAVGTVAFLAISGPVLGAVGKGLQTLSGTIKGISWLSKAAQAINVTDKTVKAAKVIGTTATVATTGWNALEEITDETLV